MIIMRRERRSVEAVIFRVERRRFVRLDCRKVSRGRGVGGRSRTWVLILMVGGGLCAWSSYVINRVRLMDVVSREIGSG